MGYRNSLLIFLLALVLFGVSVSFAYIFATQPVAPLYIPLKENGAFIELIKIDQPHKPDSEVADFVAKATKKVYTRDYINYTDQLMEAASYFTVNGFNTYIEGLETSQSLDAMKQNKWVLSFTPKQAPILLDKQVVNGAYSWVFELPGVINYYGAGSRSQNVKIKAIVTRISVVDSPYGMGIATFVPFEEK